MVHLGKMHLVTSFLLTGLWAGRAAHMGVDVDDAQEDNGSTQVACENMQHVPSGVKCMFINLDKRKDRKEGFEKQMDELLEPYKRCLGWSLERFPAIQSKSGTKKEGQLAAARSHIAVLKDSLKDKDAPVLIFEDDYRFKLDHKDLAGRLEQAFNAVNNSWDVMMLGDASYASGAADSAKDQIQHTRGSWCSEAYMVAPQYKATLLEEVEKGFQKMEKGDQYVHSNVEPQGPAYDTLWYPLQKAEGSKWFVFRPKIGAQANTWGDSNINGR